MVKKTPRFLRIRTFCNEIFSKKTEKHTNFEHESFPPKIVNISCSECATMRTMPRAFRPLKQITHIRTPYSYVLLLIRIIQINSRFLFSFVWNDNFFFDVWVSSHRPICLSFVSFFRFCMSLCFLDCFGFVYLSEIIEKIYIRHTNTRKTKIYQYQHFEWVEKSRHTHTRTRTHWHINSTIPTSLVLMNANE